MAPDKSNQYLDAASESEVEDQGYDSEAAEDSRAQRAPKRRKLTVQSEEEEEEEEEGDDGSDISDQEASDRIEEASRRIAQKSRAHASPTNEDDGASTHKRTHQARKPKVSHKDAHPLHSTIAPIPNSTHKTGVIYISRIPPYMKPTTLRTLLLPHASKGLGRIFLTPESHSAHLSRTRAGGNKKRLFTDGWVEFLSKRDARAAVEVLNTQIIGGKKGGYYHDDLWNLRYLKGFKWSHLTEQMVNEEAERASRLRAEIRQTERENRRFLENVERAKKLMGMEEKRVEKERRRLAEEGKAGNEERIEGSGDGRTAMKGFPRHFRQNEVVRKEAGQRDGHVKQPDEVQKVLSKIF